MSHTNPYKISFEYFDKHILNHLDVILRYGMNQMPFVR